jgi:F420-non-reducing hydrogenase iron-sulfur subunit
VVKADLNEELQREELETVFAPRLVVFHCQWCLPDPDYIMSLVDADMRESALTLRVNCTARVEGEFVIKALAEGFDGVLVLGCEISECHYRTGNHRALKRLLVLREMFEFGGIHPERLGALWVSPFDEGTLKALVQDYTEKLRAVGPFKRG